MGSQHPFRVRQEILKQSFLVIICCFQAYLPELRWAKPRDSYRRSESLGKVLVAIRITSVRWRSYLHPPSKPRNWSSQALRSLCGDSNRVIGSHTRKVRSVNSVGIAEWPARVDCVRLTPAIGDWRFCPSEVPKTLRF